MKQEPTVTNLCQGFGSSTVTNTTVEEDVQIPSHVVCQTWFPGYPEGQCNVTGTDRTLSHGGRIPATVFQDRAISGLDGNGR